VKIAPKSHFHTTPVITLLDSNVNDTLGLFLTIYSLEWYNSPLAIVGFFAPNLEVEAGEQFMENQPMGNSFCPNSDKGVNKPLYLK